jgi:hypothetical protein
MFAPGNCGNLVFSQNGQIYASPTLIYHYVAVHHYQPPADFVKAMFEGPRPSTEEYCALLRGLNLDWGSTSVGGHGYLNPGSYDRNVDRHTPLIELIIKKDVVKRSV